MQENKQNIYSSKGKQEKNLGKIGAGKFFKQNTKGMQCKEKNGNMDFIKIPNFCALKTPLKIKKQAEEQRSAFFHYRLKELCLEFIKISQFLNKKTSNPFFKKNLNRHIRKQLHEHSISSGNDTQRQHLSGKCKLNPQ